MNLYRRSGIATGILFIVATAAGVLALSTQPPLAASDYLAKIPASEPAVLLSALLILVMGWAGAGIGIAMTVAGSLLVLFRRIAPMSTAQA